jgi:NADPH-dependent ferric siderophore reductase
MSDAPEIQRVRHETRRRLLKVSRLERLGSKMLRVVAAGEELQGFTSLGFDDHVKLFFPEAGMDASADARPPMRDFTPRKYDPVAGELWIDFFLHDDGPAGSWAAQAAVGQNITVGGPRGSSIIPLEGIDTHLLIGDETALPAIGRRLEELPPGTRAICVIETEDGQAGYPLSSQARIEIHWARRAAGAAAPAGALVEALRKVELPAQRCFAWAALEMQAARAMRRYLIEERGFDKHWVKAAAYWQRDGEGIHAVIGDED